MSIDSKYITIVTIASLGNKMTTQKKGLLKEIFKECFINIKIQDILLLQTKINSLWIKYFNGKDSF